jgi:hypothetical protein
MCYWSHSETWIMWWTGATYVEADYHALVLAKHVGCKVECGVSGGKSIPFWIQSATRVQTRKGTWDCQNLPHPPPNRGPSDLRKQFKSFGMCVCVCWGESIMNVFTFPWCKLPFRLVSWRHCLEDSFIWIYSDLSEVTTRNEIPHSTYMRLDVQPWPQTPHVEIDELQFAYPED